MSTLLSPERTCDDDHQRTIKENHDQDLMLAAEIGKSLLERNRELELVLKATQEYAEEQAAQTEFYLKQVEILRDGNETSSRACEQLEANNRILSDKCEQWKNDAKILEGKNTRLWEVINNLETRVEELTSEVDRVNQELTEIKEKEERERELKMRNELQRKPPEEQPEQQQERHVNFHDPVTTELPSPCEAEKECLKKQVSELNIQNKLTRLEKGEMESQLVDLVTENQALYHKISNLNQEIGEWEKFAQKEENYRRLAAAFTLKHYAEEVEPETLDEVERKITQTLLPTTKMTKAKSCECIDYFSTSKERDTRRLVKSPTLVNNILSNVNSSSFLSELDSEYADLVKRYEALLEKFTKQEGQLNANPERTKKVQRAIQTLSMDFSTMLKSPTKTMVNADTSPMRTESTGFGTSPMRESVGIGTMKSPDGDDYRKMFSDIFAKLKESGLST